MGAKNMEIKNVSSRTLELPALNDKCPGGSIQPGAVVDFPGGEAYLKHEVISSWLKPENAMLELVVVAKEEKPKAEKAPKDKDI